MCWSLLMTSTPASSMARRRNRASIVAVWVRSWSLWNQSTTWENPCSRRDHRLPSDPARSDRPAAADRGPAELTRPTAGKRTGRGGSGDAITPRISRGLPAVASAVKLG
jgi:hypothetical protein